MSGRADLAQLLPSDSNAATKTFVLEVHAEDPDDYLNQVAGRRFVLPTEDAYLHRVILESRGEFWIDRLNPRFWSFHTTMPAAVAGPWLHDKVESRRDTDWVWLPSNHLRYVAPGSASYRVRTEFLGDRLLGADERAQDLKVQLTGAHAETLLDRIWALPEYRSAVNFNSIEVLIEDPDIGIVREAVKRNGSFAVYGDDFNFHAQFVNSVIDRYAALVDAIEGLCIDFEPFSGGADALEDDAAVMGGTVSGTPIGIRFSRSISDVPAFCDELFNSRTPFRLWGRPTIERDVAFVEAVDLHVGQRLRLDVGHDWVRAYLPKGSCGNTIARLVSNLQGRFDAALTFTNDALNRSLQLAPQVA
jgi:hypothetical protein